MESCAEDSKKRSAPNIDDVPLPKKPALDISIGIDLGTTYSCVATWINGHIEIIPNESGNRTLPSYVAFTDTHRLIGEAAKSQVFSNPFNTVFDAKRLIGRQFDDLEVQSDMKHWPFKVIRGDGNKPMIEVQFKGEKMIFAPEQISSMVLGKLKQVAEEYIGKPVRNAVVTVPAYFNDSQRQSTKDAGTIAGLNVIRIINEPTAASIAYGLDRDTSKGEKNILIFDLGGGTFDVSLLSVENGIFDVKSTAGDTHLGGEDFDTRMVNHFVNEFKIKYKRDISRDQKALRRLRSACERAKRILSTELTAQIQVDSIYDGIDFISEISRAKFEELNIDYFKKCMDPVRKVIQDAHLKAEQINEIVLVGGSTRIPKVQSLLQGYFCGKKLCNTLNQDEAVAYGAAVQASILCGNIHLKNDSIILLDVIPLSVGVETTGGVMDVLIPRNSTIPIRKQQIYTTNVDNQEVVDIQVFEGERPFTKDNHKLAQFSLSGLSKMPKGIPQIDVTFDIDSNGILTVYAKEISSKTEAHIKVTTDRGEYSNEDINKLLVEAEKYRELDIEAQHKINAKQSLDTYSFSAFNQCKKRDINKFIKAEEVKFIKDKIAITKNWLDLDSDKRSANDFKEKEEELMILVEPLLSKMYILPAYENEWIEGPCGCIVDFAEK